MLLLIQTINSICTDQLLTYNTFIKVHSMLAPQFSTLCHLKFPRWLNSGKLCRASSRVRRLYCR